MQLQVHPWHLRHPTTTHHSYHLCCAPQHRLLALLYRPAAVVGATQQEGCPWCECSLWCVLLVLVLMLRVVQAAGGTDPNWVFSLALQSSML